MRGRHSFGHGFDLQVTALSGQCTKHTQFRSDESPKTFPTLEVLGRSGLLLLAGAIPAWAWRPFGLLDINFCSQRERMAVVMLRKSADFIYFMKNMNRMHNVLYFFKHR